MPENTSSIFQAEFGQFTFCTQSFNVSKEHEALNSLSHFTMQEKSYLHFAYGSLFSVWNPGTINWIQLSSHNFILFYLKMNSFRLKVLNKTRPDFSNENQTLHWHYVKEVGRDSSSVASQKHHPCFQPQKGKKKKNLCSVVSQFVIWGPVHLSMLLLIKTELSEAGAAPYGYHVWHFAVWYS